MIDGFQFEAHNGPIYVYVIYFYVYLIVTSTVGMKFCVKTAQFILISNISLIGTAGPLHPNKET